MMASTSADAAAGALHGCVPVMVVVVGHHHDPPSHDVTEQNMTAELVGEVEKSLLSAKLLLVVVKRYDELIIIASTTTTTWGMSRVGKVLLL
eukprot:CAMPEP_0185759000 /NCGR_PEP_ID=MMETSP1174-20130828/17695_1 /TAXON_ID=35687 /ORGANISM="Dictyocha speculum, Strain CCMP1381" /LENGTH=91 /DNA_ID=CAMNT_0028439113 /DNA_START=30 /DNA_END=303 /DNA_ORIENTATION=-